MECACPSIRPWWGGARKCGSGILPPDTAECRPEYSGPETAGSSGKPLFAGAVVLRGGAGRRGVRTAAREDFRHVRPARSTKLRMRGIGPGPCGARAYSTGGRHFGIDRGGEATVPFTSDIRSAAANIRCEMASTLRRNSLKRIAPSGPERRQERLRPSGARSARYVPDGAHSARMKIFRFSIILFL